MVHAGVPRRLSSAAAVHYANRIAVKLPVRSSVLTRGGAVSATAQMATAAAGGGPASGNTSPTSQASGAPARSAAGGSDFNPSDIAELRDSKQELILKVQTMKKELSDWRVRMNQQVEGYRTDLTALQATLTSEMGGLRSELADVKARIRAQLEANGEAIASLHARGDLATRAGLEEAAVAAAAAEGAKARG